MKFDDCISYLYGGDDLERLSSAYTAIPGGGLFSRKKSDPDKLISAIGKAKDKYCDIVNIRKAMAELADNADPDIRMTFPVILGKILLEKSGFCYERNSVTLETIEYERDIIRKASRLSINKLTPEMNAYRFLLKTAFEKGRNLSDEMTGILSAMREYYRINEDDGRMLEASLGVYPSGEKLTVHTKQKIEQVRQELQKSGALFSIRKSDGIIYDIVPEEIAAGIKIYFGTEIKSAAYDKIIEFLIAGYKKQYLADVLTSFGIETPVKPNVLQLTALVKKYLKPSELLSGKSTNDGLNRQALADWCTKIGQNRIGSKTALIAKLLDYYENTVDKELDCDYRVRYYKNYEGIAVLNTDILKDEAAPDIACGAEGIFAETTNYIFEILLCAHPERLLSKANITGKVMDSDKIYLYSAIASQKPAELSEHMEDIRSSVEAEGKTNVAAFIVVAGDFTEESVKECVKFYVENDVQILLIKASELKELADKWSERTGVEAFPVIYLRQNGRFDIKRCDLHA